MSNRPLLYHWTNIMAIGYQHHIFFKSSIRKEIKTSLDEFGINNGQIDIKDEQRLEEMAREYINICLGSHKYKSTLWGLKKLSEKQVSIKVCENIHSGIYYGLVKLGFEEESKIFAKAFYKPFIEAFKTGQEVWERYFS